MTPLSKKLPFSTWVETDFLQRTRLKGWETQKPTTGSLKKSCMSIQKFDLNPYVEDYASGEHYWCEHSNGKPFVRRFVRVLRAAN